MRANRFFYTLLALAVLGLGLLAGGLFNLSMHFLPPSLETTNLCGKLFEVAADLGYPPELVGYPLLALMATLLGLSLGSFVTHVRNTRRLVQSLTYPRLRAHAQRPSLTAVALHLGLAGRIDVVASPRRYAFCYGFLRPRVCVTTGLIADLDDAELEAVLTHERRHVENYDPLKLLVAETLRAGLFFLPVLYDLSQRFRRRMELDADQRAIQKCGAVVLASALYKMLTGPWPLRLAPNLTVGALDLAGERIDQIINPHARQHHPMPWSRLIASIIVLVLLLLVGLPVAQDRNLPGAARVSQTLVAPSVSQTIVQPESVLHKNAVEARDNLAGIQVVEDGDKYLCKSELICGTLSSH
ncbi:MAG: M56 family peptidase [Chloroflexi bacterium]|nr:M56 family peptidase [Chloroflexota bacterium]